MILVIVEAENIVGRNKNSLSVLFKNVFKNVISLMSLELRVVKGLYLLAESKFHNLEKSFKNVLYFDNFITLIGTLYLSIQTFDDP